MNISAVTKNTHDLLIEPSSIVNAEDRQLPFAMRQHLSVMGYIETAGRRNVSTLLRNTEHAIEELIGCYSEHFIHEISTLDLEQEIEKFNQYRGFETLSFVDWYALRDYQEDGYLAINKYLRDPDSVSAPEYCQCHINQLTLSLMHLIKIQSPYCQSNAVFYRGQVMPEKAVAAIDVGAIFSPSCFFSAYEDEDAASGFCADSVAPAQMNVMFEIEKTTPLAGADLSLAVYHDEGNMLFLPKTQFDVTRKDYDEQTAVMTIGLRTCEMDSNTFEDALHEHIFLRYQ